MLSVQNKVGGDEAGNRAGAKTLRVMGTRLGNLVLSCKPIMGAYQNHPLSSCKVLMLRPYYQ